MTPVWEPLNVSTAAARMDETAEEAAVVVRGVVLLATGTAATASSSASGSRRCWKHRFPRTSRELAGRYRARLQFLAARYADERATAELAATQTREHVRRVAVLVAPAPAAVSSPVEHGNTAGGVGAAVAGADAGARDGQAAAPSGIQETAAARQRARMAAYVQHYAQGTAQGTRGRCERVATLFGQRLRGRWSSRNVWSRCGSWRRGVGETSVIAFFRTTAVRMVRACVSVNRCRR